jgi:hypothetical protein
MTGIDFPETNITFGPPPHLTELLCLSIRAFQHDVLGGSCDGEPQVVVCYQLEPEEIAFLQQNGGKIFVSMLGGLAPHYLSFDFYNATHPA